MKIIVAVLCVTRRWALHIVVKLQFLHLFRKKLSSCRETARRSILFRKVI